MAIKQLFIAFAVIAVILPSLTSAMEYTVGDASGWTNNYNYTAWAEGKDFHVGDTLVFKYPVGAHNVFKVNATSFTNCTIPPVNEALTSGNDVVTLAAPGKKWYICGVKKHCKEAGQKLVITVTDAAPAPAPNSADGILKSGFQVLIAATIATAMIFGA